MKKQNVNSLRLRKKSIAAYNIMGGANGNAETTHSPCLETCCKCPAEKSKRPNICHI